MYLIDTDILSHAAPVRNPPPAMVEWMETHTDALYLSAVTLTEVEAGIAKARRKNAPQKARALARWLDAIVHLYADRIIAIDLPIARLAGRMADTARALGIDPGLADILIAASARERRLVVLTRNVRHFSPLVAAIDPFVALPHD